MPAHPVYEGTAKVRVLPQGVCGDDLDPTKKLAPKFKKFAPEGYDDVQKTARRVKLAPQTIYGMLRYGRIPGALWNGKRVFVPRSWVPDKNWDRRKRPK